MLLRAALLRAGVVIVAVAALLSAPACGNDPVGVDSCRKIEDARCENAPSCGIDLSQPVHRGNTPGLDVGACKRFYDDACMHGFATGTDPGSVATQACVDAINNASDCAIVKNPELSPACVFLIPPATDAAAATDALPVYGADSSTD